MIKLVEESYLPRDQEKIDAAEALLQQLIDEGVTGPDLVNFQAVVQHARDQLQFDVDQLSRFRSDYAIQGCLGSPGSIAPEDRETRSVVDLITAHAAIQLSILDAPGSASAIQKGDLGQRSASADEAGDVGITTWVGCGCA